jgi:hypothetical protein
MRRSSLLLSLPTSALSRPLTTPPPLVLLLLLLINPTASCSSSVKPCKVQPKQAAVTAGEREASVTPVRLTMQAAGLGAAETAES